VLGDDFFVLAHAHEHALQSEQEAVSAPRSGLEQLDNGDATESWLVWREEIPGLDDAADELFVSHFWEEVVPLAAKEVIESLREVHEEVAQDRQARCRTAGIQFSFIMILIVGDQSAAVLEEGGRLLAVHRKCVDIHVSLRQRKMDVGDANDGRDALERIRAQQ